MVWSGLETRWRSLVGDQPLTQGRPPFQAATPTEPWVYAAISAPLPSGPAPLAIKVRARAIEAEIGIALVKPNGSALLSQEARIAPDDGVREILFRLDPAYGPACLLLRKLSEDACIGRAEVLEVFSAPVDGLAETLLGPSDDYLVYPDISASNIARADEPMWPVSIGNTCEARMQISRVLQFRRHPETSHAAFRLKMLPPHAADVFGWDLFDWQGTPLTAVMAYLREDFQGVFERGDLAPSEIGVMHRRLGAEHMHDFAKWRGKGEPAFTQAMIDLGYPSARAQFDEMAEAFRRRLASPGPYLYVHVCEDIPTELTVRQLIRMLGARSPDHRFHLLFVGFEDEDSDLSALSDQVSKAYRPRPARLPRPGTNEWEGDYAAWDKALAPFDLLLPGESPSRSAAPVSAAGKRPGRLARLFSR